MIVLQRCAMLRCCGCVWLPPNKIFGTHSLAPVETVVETQLSYGFYMRKDEYSTQLWMRAIDVFSLR
ncbi:hypothetical protein SFRURICE_007509 [Spodoptera frugiperda]|nr:hypothetical protein SFRURICE_007509 [Spodoptera frugiperda]